MQSSASGGSGALLPRLCWWAPPCDGGGWGREPDGPHYHVYGDAAPFTWALGTWRNPYADGLAGHTPRRPWGQSECCMQSVVLQHSHACRLFLLWAVLHHSPTQWVYLHTCRAEVPAETPAHTISLSKTTSKEFCNDSGRASWVCVRSPP